MRGKVNDTNAINLISFLRQAEQTKGQLRNPSNYRKGMRSRVTSTSFYHMNLRERDRVERERVKTEEEDAHL